MSTNIPTTLFFVSVLLLFVSCTPLTRTTSEEHVPILLLHGFNPVYSANIGELSLDPLQEQLSHDLGYEDGGILEPGKPCKTNGSNVVFRSSYYIFGELGSIEEYSRVLGRILDSVEECTNASRVDIVAHSMGGIVTRYYLKNTSDRRIRKVIMLGTPNHGGLYGVGELANVVATTREPQYVKDFVQLSSNSTFLAELNSQQNSTRIEFYTVAGLVDGRGDLLIEASAVPLNDSGHNIVVHCSHFVMKFPKQCPLAYAFVLKSLED